MHIHGREARFLDSLNAFHANFGPLILHRKVSQEVSKDSRDMRQLLHEDEDERNLPRWRIVLLLERIGSEEGLPSILDNIATDRQAGGVPAPFLALPRWPVLGLT